MKSPGSTDQWEKSQETNETDHTRNEQNGSKYCYDSKTLPRPTPALIFVNSVEYWLHDPAPQPP
jgi:hypothetical protein